MGFLTGFLQDGKGFLDRGSEWRTGEFLKGFLTREVLVEDNGVPDRVPCGG